MNIMIYCTHSWSLRTYAHRHSYNLNYAKELFHSSSNKTVLTRISENKWTKKHDYVHWVFGHM